MSIRIARGSEIKYTCIALSSKEYERAICDVNSSIRGFVVDGAYRPAEDTELSLSKDWSITVTAAYPQRKYWVIIQEHPSDVYGVMSDIVQQDIYSVVEYDIWRVNVDYTGASELAAVGMIIDTD